MEGRGATRIDPPMQFETPLAARAAVRSLIASKIRELYNEGVGRSDILPFWVGEPDEPTPEFIRRAGIASIEAGEVFYSHNYGIPELREALRVYLSTLHKRKIEDGQLAVTSAGVNALMLASQLLIDPGDRVVEVVPLWPNLQEIPKILGAEVATVALEFSPQGWSLDMERLLAALAPGTRALYLNSPNNPTGWTISPAEQKTLLEHCERHGIWIFADDAYERLYFDDDVAPSFLDLMHDGDRVISTNTFSKAWLMTGWRLGWLVVPPSLVADLGKLIEYNTSCTPIFVQRAGIAALHDGEAVIARSLERLRRARDFLVAELRKLARVEVAVPAGTMYVFLRIAGMADSLAFCKELVRRHGLGLAPGAAFGPAGEGYVRWCFAAELEKLADGVARLRRAL